MEDEFDIDPDTLMSYLVKKKQQERNNMKTVKFAPIKGDEDKTTLILDGANNVIGYYDYSWARLGGMMYRYGHNIGMITDTTRSGIEEAITRRLTKEL